MAKFKPYKIESSELTSLEREEGQFIVTTDTQKIYLDSDNSNRIELGGKDGTVTSIATGAGLTGGTITNSGTIKANLKSETKSTLAAADMGSTANRQYAVGIDTNDKLSVNIPWTDNNTTYTFATGDNNGEIKVTPSGGSAQGVAVKGLNNAAYKDTDSSISAASTSTKLPTSQAVASFVEGKGYTTNTGTITGVSVNGTSIATSGTANITSVPASILTGAIPSAVTASTQSQGDNSTKIATTAYVDTAIDNLPEPMVFKGSLGTGGTIASLPVDGSATIGDTYKVITDGTYASKTAKVGDTFICLTKTSNANTWELIPSGDEPSGTVTSITLNATSPIAIDNNAAITTSGSRTISHANSGVTAGTYKSVTVNATGHITAGSNPTTISGYGITDAKIDNGVITLGSNTITPLTSEVNSNLLNGSTTASLRGIGTVEESNDYTIGSYAFAEGSYTEASGFASHAEGASTKATYEYCHAEGCMSEAYGSVSHAEGWNTRANGGSHAEGNLTSAIAYNSHTEGSYSVTAGGYGAHAEGNGGDWDKVLVDSATISSINENVITLTTTPKETFVGCYAELLGSTSTGFGYSRLIEAIDKTQNTITFISRANLSEFSVGNTIEFYLIGSTAVGDGSHAEGSYTHAVGDHSHAEGGWTTAASDYQHVQGKYNILDLNSTYSDIIGNGTANNTRSNAATVDWSGNAWYAGDVYVGSTSGTNKDSGSVKLAKVSELPSAGTGINITSGVVTNTGVVNVEASPSAAGNGTIAVTKGTTGGTSTTYVSVKGLNNAAYKNIDSSISAASTSTQLPTSQAVAAFVEGKGYLTSYTETDPVFTASPAYGITNSNITDWNNKISQYSTMPQASSETVGEIVQYIGTTNNTYTHGYFYEGDSIEVLDGETFETITTYVWKHIDVQSSNYLAKDNATLYTPTGNYNPATKKYVDDACAKDYEIYYWDGKSSSQTSSNLQLFQDILDKHLAGKDILIIRNNTEVANIYPDMYVLDHTMSPTTSGSTASYTIYSQVRMVKGTSPSYSEFQQKYNKIVINMTAADVTTVTSVTTTSSTTRGTFIEPETSYGTPFVPTANGHPATKKYVDDSISAISTGIHSFYGTTDPTTVTGSVDGDIYIVIDA